MPARKSTRRTAKKPAATRRSAARPTRGTGTTASKGARSKPGIAGRAADAERARTIVYVHGIGNKPPESILRCQWDTALMGFGLGERSRLAYWCQSDRHGPPVNDSCGGSDAIQASSVGSPGYGARSFAREESLDALIAEIGETPAERETLERLRKEMQAASPPPRGPRAARMRAGGLESLDVPDFITRWVTALFLKDARDFFFDEERRERMRRSLLERLASGGGPFVVVAHSQGSMIAWSALLDVDPARHDIPLLVTLGSPLSLREVQAQLRRIHRIRGKGPLPVPACVRSWRNFHDARDIVARGGPLGRFFEPGRGLEDDDVLNPDRKRDPHSATGYLSLAVVRSCVREAVDVQRFQPVAPFMLAADAVTDFEQRPASDRRPLLIELTDPEWAERQVIGQLADAGAEEAKRLRARHLPRTSSEMAEALRHAVRQVVGDGVPDSELAFQTMRRYVSVRLTRAEAERLAADPTLGSAGLAVPPFYRIWRNAKKVALLESSIHTVQASAAHRSYDALGEGINVAVLDSGCTAHPHFNSYDTIAARWDCTLRSDEPLKDGTKVDDQRADSSDHYGHGTHVAGIVAGHYEVVQADGRTRTLCGIAPRARLHIYKVLDDKGEGEDAWIIKAIDHVVSVNERAGRLAIPIVNLSLGGPFEQGVFGCGHTPLCDELRRLWRQGVVVVLAAGNEGFARLMSSDGELGANMSFSIGDPANLEEAIAVGAIHKERPFTYGVSHFSSRGPTADGRRKPDCVAPGEQILSCRHKVNARQKTVRDLYMKLDGTSMAAPHVAGMIACFLSRRKEFIGDPDRVKKILLESCTDLGRDRLLQGAGMPNLVRMLMQT